MRDAILAALNHEISVRVGGKAKKLKRLDAIADQTGSTARRPSLSPATRTIR
jgi:hypothetical protein